MTAYYRITEWSTYQHYKDRNPPWIKLHREMMTSRTWVSLDDSGRVLAVACMMLAAATGNKIPADASYVRRVAYLNSDPDFAPLLSIGFVELIDENSKTASATLAHDSVTKADACSETEQRQSRAEQSAPGAESKPPEPARPAQPALPPPSPNPRPVLDLWERIQVEVYGCERRQMPAGDDGIYARRWLQSGADLAMLEPLFRSKLAAKRKAGEAAIGALKFFDAAVKDLIVKANSADMPKRLSKPPRPPPVDQKSEIEDQMQRLLATKPTEAA